MTQRSPIPVLRCAAGGIPLGLAAEEVAEFRPNDRDGNAAGAARLAQLLGLAADGDQSAHSDVTQERTLRLKGGGATALVRVEGPVHIRSVSGGDLLPTPRWLAGAALAPVIGFLEENGRVVVLLDVAGVIDLAAGAAPGAGADMTRARGEGQPC